MENLNLNINPGAMCKRRETMADGRRYIIYYTFEKNQPSGSESDAEQTTNPKSEIRNPKSEAGGENV
jgi:hypothetical protein